MKVPCSWLVLGLLAGQDTSPPRPGPVAAVVTPDAVVLHLPSGARAPVPGTAGARGVAFSADGESLFVAGPSDLRRVALDGDLLQPVTEGWEQIDTPAVSPDGRALAFAGYTRAAKWSVYVVRGRNANPERVAHGFAPAWLADSRTLLFENYTDQSAQIWRHDPDTRSVERVPYDAAGVLETAVHAVPLPDFSALTVASGGGIHRIDLETGERTELTSSEHYDARQVFTADAGRMYFVRRTRDPRRGRVDPRVMVLDLETGGTRLFHDTPATAVAVPRGP